MHIPKTLHLLILPFIFLLTVPDQINAQAEYYITGADETELFVQEYGEGNPVVLLSGGPLLNIDYLKDIWENLNSQFRWIVFHQRGTGKSQIEDPDSTLFSLKNYVTDLEALRNELEVDQLTLVGHSWGGMLAMEYAAQHPKQVQKMVFLASGGPTINFTRYFYDNINMRLHDSDRAELEKLGRQNKEAMPVAFPGYFYDRERALQIREKTNFEKWQGQLQFTPFVVKNYMAATKERVKGLKNYNGPVELIQGRQDPIGESTAYEIKEIMPQTEISFIERAGHFPWLENKKQKDIFFNLLSKSLVNE